MRLIDADALDMYEVLKSYYGDAWRDAQEAIDSAPTVDAVPVVRCKDCTGFKRDEGEGIEGWCIAMGTGAEKDGYCSIGERRP